MYRALVAALFCCLLVSPVSAEERQPTAIELAASVAVCMHQGRAYPTEDGLDGIYVEGGLASAHLSEGNETFAVIYAPDGHMVMESLSGPAIRGSAWARERERYAIGCFGLATATAPSSRSRS